MKKQVVVTLDNNIYNHLQTVLKATGKKCQYGYGKPY